MTNNTKPASEKQLALIAKYSMPVHSDTLTIEEAAKIIDTYAKLNNWKQNNYTPKAKKEDIVPNADDF